ncbi:hypothetical protein ACFP56_18885 [Paenibacillus septentrionalis]|uniref:SMP-30/Gluconolactonase/LRE-like region domain-containing protein n=2 Tax=Paenibacillus septentrionalis TaxID=429342 RepID=A0ABW1V7G0_9BACL
MKKILLFVCLLGMLLPSTRVFADNTLETNYIYDFWGSVNKSLPAFELMYTLDESSLGQIKMRSIDDAYVSKDRIFLVDSEESRVNVIGSDLQFQHSIKLIRDQNNKIIVDSVTNKQLMLDKPEGVFYSDYSDELYIADTGAERIIVLDGTDYHLKRMINKPENMVGATQFKPSKIVVDKDGKISVIVQGSYEGIIEIHNNGSFSRYFGLNKPRVNIIDHFWKSIATKEQKEKMKKVFAPSFNNLSIDTEGMIYATTFDPSAKDKVFRFNSKGENVLMENGYFSVIGDLTYGTDEERSQFIDIAVSDFGVYALLDKTKGRVFIYNFQGDLMNIFGSSGYLKGDVREPTAINWFGDKLIITDKQFAAAYIYQPTEFGEAALHAEKQYFYGQWEDAGASYEKTIELNSNYDIAYTGVGRNYLMQDEYEKAMYYSELGNSRGYFSKAYAEYRNIIIQHNFIWLVIPFVLFAGYLIYSEYRYNRKNG